MKFFDINCMLGPTNTNREPAFRDAASLLAEMDRVGIHEALVYSSLSRHAHPADGNAWLLEAVHGQERLHPCWVALPPGTGELPEPKKFVEQMQQNGVRAARVLPELHRYPLLERTFRPLFQALAEARIPLLIDTERVSWAQTKLDWNEIFNIAERHPDLPLVLLREGGTTQRVLFEVWNDFPNIHLETSYLQESRSIEEVCQRFGSEKLLFGTAMPHFDPGGALGFVNGAQISCDARATVAGNNARRLLGLPEYSVEVTTEPQLTRGFRVFDTHGHIGRWEHRYYSDWTAQHMVANMDTLGIERFCVSDILGIGPAFREGNTRVGKAVAEFPDRIVGYAVYNPNYESEMRAEMTRCFDELGCSGIKLHCATHDTSTEDRSYRLAFQIANERACPVLCHVHDGPSPDYLKGILREFPNMKFIYAHVGGGARVTTEPLLDVVHECPNLFLELGSSSIPRGAFAWLTQNAPVEQIVYGSDHPLNDFTYQLGKVLYADVSDDVKRRVLWDNAANIFAPTQQKS